MRLFGCVLLPVAVVAIRSDAVDGAIVGIHLEPVRVDIVFLVEIHVGPLDIVAVGLNTEWRDAGRVTSLTARRADARWADGHRRGTFLLSRVLRVLRGIGENVLQ